MNNEITWNFKYMELGEVQKDYPIYNCYTKPIADFYWKIKKGSHDHFEIRKDGGEWISHNDNKYTWNGFTEGEHTFEVKNIDNEGTPSNTLKFIFYYYIVNEIINQIQLDLDGQSIFSSIDYNTNKLFLTSGYMQDDNGFFKNYLAVIDIPTMNIDIETYCNVDTHITTMAHNPIDNNELYITSYDRNKNVKNRLYKLDINRKRKIWEMDYNNITDSSYNLMKFEVSNDNSTLYTGSGNKLVLIDNNTGNIKQIKELNGVGSNVIYSDKKGITNNTYCKIDGDYLYIIADIFFICYNIKTNTIKWQNNLKAINARMPFKIIGNYIYCIVSDPFRTYFMKINKIDGEIIYSTTLKNATYFDSAWENHNNFIRTLFNIQNDYAIVLTRNFNSEEKCVFYKLDINTGEILLEKVNNEIYRNNGIVVDTFGRTYMLYQGNSNCPSKINYYDTDFNLIWDTTLPCTLDANAMFIYNNILYVIPFNIYGGSFSYNGKTISQIGRGREIFLYIIDPYKNTNGYKTTYNSRIYKLWNSLQGPESNK